MCCLTLPLYAKSVACQIIVHTLTVINYNNYCVSTISNEDTNEYALKLIEGAGLSMSACREIAVSYINTLDK